MASMAEFNTMIDGTVSNRDKISRATGRIQGWSRRLDRKQLSRDFNLCREERRMERLRIAGELHDTLLQGFLGASLVLHSTLEQMPMDSPTKPALAHAVRLMQRAIDEGRGVLQGLRSSVVASTSLEQAFSDLMNEFAQAGGVRFRILVTGKPKTLKPAIQQQMYLIGREALVNAMRHSNATRIEAEVEYLPRQLHVVVRDNGCGIDPEVIRSGRNSHWGLPGMHERARGIGAQVRIFSRQGAGAVVEISIPGHIAADA
jgi:signal transduction histidine kinase